MSYVFESPERLAFEIRRVAVERLDDALEQLSGGLSRDAAAAVHEARKDLKKTRSLLRLVRDSLGDDRFSSENSRLRDAAHSLASVRESDAMVESLEALIEHAGQGMSSEARQGAQAWLATLSDERAPGVDALSAAAQASPLIAQARDDARLWALGYESFGLIEQGIRRTYRQGRRALAAAADSPDDEALHEWRKRVKDMWYSLRLLGQVWEPVMRPLADQTHELSDLLGDHHDLGEVRAAIQAGDSGLSATSRDELLAAVCARQEELHRDAISLGRRLYAERPKRYAERLGRLWVAWETGAAQQVGQDGLPGS